MGLITGWIFEIFVVAINIALWKYEIYEWYFVPISIFLLIIGLTYIYYS